MGQNSRGQNYRTPRYRFFTRRGSFCLRLYPAVCARQFVPHSDPVSEVTEALHPAESGHRRRTGFQAAHDTKRALDRLPAADQNEVLKSIAGKQIKEVALSATDRFKSLSTHKQSA